MNVFLRVIGILFGAFCALVGVGGPLLSLYLFDVHGYDQEPFVTAAGIIGFLWVVFWGGFAIAMWGITEKEFQRRRSMPPKIKRAKVSNEDLMAYLQEVNNPTVGINAVPLKYTDPAVWPGKSPYQATADCLRKQATMETSSGDEGVYCPNETDVTHNHGMNVSGNHHVHINTPYHTEDGGH